MDVEIEKSVINCGVFGTRHNGWNSRICCFVCGGGPSHVGFYWQYDDGSRIYMEALFRKGIVEQGPEDWNNLHDWLQEDVSRRLYLHNLPLNDADANYLLQECKKSVGRKGYNEWQLIQQWKFERIGRWFNWFPSVTPDMVTCGEWVSERLFTLFKIDTRDKQRKIFDVVNPHSLWVRLLEMKKKKEGRYAFKA